jgi:phosphoribosylanthranilate isomerase
MLRGDRRADCQLIETPASAGVSMFTPCGTRYRWSMSDTAPRIKVCGITRLRDAELAVELGAWAVGMVFYEPSPRACSAVQALRIASTLRRRVEVCGVFVNAPLDEVVHLSEALSLTMLQLHGDEGPAFCAEAGHRTGARVIKAVQVSTIGEVRDVERFHTDFHLLDARSTAPGRQELRGGTGEAFDWGLLAARRSSVPLILSGGLAPENAAEAILAASRQGHRARPFALDTASGTEAAPGRKDPERLRAFFAAVQDASLAPELR